jgi:predicted TIM-barrel fold metal-dependent hydrolase
MTAGLAMLPALATRATLEDLYVSMQAHGIDRTVVIAAWPSSPNEWLLPAARASGGRVVPVAHPCRLAETDSEETWLDAYAALWEEGARGFKIHHNMDGLPVDSRAYRTMFEVASSTGSFVIVHTGCFNVIGYAHQRPATPALFTTLFEDYPGVRVCLAHMNRDHPDAAFDVVERFENVYVDTSWQPVTAVRAAIDRIGAERVLLGSDWPLLHADLQGDCLSVVQRAATDAEQEIILDTAARRFIGES